MEPADVSHIPEDAGRSSVVSASHGPGRAAAIAIWLALVLLTLLTVQMHGFHVLLPGLLIALLIAATKTVLISAYYMHLRYEKPAVRFMVLMTALILGWTILLIFADPLFR